MWKVPVAIEDAVLAATREVVGEAALGTSALVRAIVDRSQRYTSDRDRLAAPKDRVGDLAARAAFFTIADAIKIAIPFGELARRGVVPPRTPLAVLDLGAGCGALSLGLATLAPITVTAIDHDAQALAIAARALRTLGATVTTRTGDVTKLALPAADLVIIGTLLNELPAAARLPLVTAALAAIPADGAVIIVEPALRDTTRALHELRDAVLVAGLAHVFAPCTRRGAPCPALADPDDWCHEDRDVRLPPHTAELARLTHLRDDGLKFSYLVLRKDAAPLVESAGAWRVVSAVHAPKGKLELLGCSDAGRLPIRLLRRHRNDNNRVLERAHRGDVLVIDAPPGDERVEVIAETRVERVQVEDT